MQQHNWHVPCCLPSTHLGGGEECGHKLNTAALGGELAYGQALHLRKTRGGAV